MVTAELDRSVKDFRGQHLLMATGRRLNTDGLGLDADRGERGEVAVDTGLRSTNPAVYAVGGISSASTRRAVSGWRRSGLASTP